MSDDEDVGTLQRLSPREVFDHEAHDFTVWMERNIDALSSTLDIDLETAEREKTAGDFSVDLLAENESGDRVIIENQLEQTNHKHLGQLLTYLTMLDAQIAIWVTADARPEHVSSISWLNENASGADFYLVKVEGIRVDDSRPAPLFTRIVGPSPGTRAAEQTKKEWDERDRIRHQFFKGLLDRTADYTNRFDSISAKPRSHVGASGGRGFAFGYNVRQHKSRAHLWIHFGKTQAVNDAAYAVFEEHREEIDSNVEYDLEWIQDENRRRLIYHSVSVGYEDEDQWEQAHKELASSMAQLEAAVKPYLEEAQEAADRYEWKLDTEDTEVE